jgi:DnaJ-class molecular chaperone
MAKFGFAA